MAENDSEQHTGAARDHLEMDFRIAEFPSDALSVRRLRKVFPNQFDGRGRIGDNYANNNFFLPVALEAPDHLVKLTQVICDERTIASGAFYERFLHQSPELLDKEDREQIERSKERLEEHYQFFRLANNPQSARFLIEQVELEGRVQADRIHQRGR